MRTKYALFVIFCIQTLFSFAQTDVLNQLTGFDQYMEKTLKDWNTPGACVGIVKNDKLIFAKGYGYRDYGKKLPVTPNTLYQIASNTKLFTAATVGFLVEDGKLDWDKPVKKYVPSIQFFNDDLNNSITIRDMLSHRTGISRHDLIWYKSDFSRKELFDRLKYLEPSQPLRQGFLYNNMMYAASGYVVELLSGKTWENFLKENILNPLEMRSTVFSIAGMKKQPDYFVPFNEKRDTNTLYQIPWYEETGGLGPAGALISNVNDMSHWLIALMNNGNYKGKQIIPPSVLKATMEPATPQINSALAKGYKEILNPVYGMGRGFTSYRGHLIVSHGGDLPGIHSQISMIPQDSFGVIVFVIGDQSAPLYNIISFNLFERLLGLDQTPWSERQLKERDAGKKADKAGRQKVGGDRVIGTKPSHVLADYVGEYENPAYGIIKITKKDTGGLQFALHRISMPLSHIHYDRFDTPNDEENGLFSLNFSINPQGDIDKLVTSIDEGEAAFIRKPDGTLTDVATLNPYIGKYQIGGTVMEVVIKNGNQLFLIIPGTPSIQLIPYKPRLFHTKEFSDLAIEFVMEAGKVTMMKQKDPSGEYEMIKKY